MIKYRHIVVSLFFLLLMNSVHGQTQRHLVVYNQQLEEIQPISLAYADTLKMDLYIPNIKVGKFPCVIMVTAFSKYNFRKGTMYRDWARLLASEGIIGVIYETVDPINDFDKLHNFILKNSMQLHVDTSRLALWSCSGNSLLAINKATQKGSYKAQVVYYGLTATANSDQLAAVKTFCNEFGITFFIDREYQSKVPTQLVRAGRDSWTLIQACIEEFTRELIEKNIPFELINYPEGHHNFDVIDNTPRSREIIRQTLDFLKANFD